MSDERQRPPIDWTAITDDLTARGKEMLDLFSAKAKHNASLVEQGDYGADALLDDITDFWKGVAIAVEETVTSWRTHVVHRDDGT
jgi:hypothetical protein